MLPPSYRDLLEVLAAAGRPLRAGGIAAAAGLSTDKSKIEGLRSKLKRPAERGWLAEDGPGLFTLPHRDGQDASYTRPPKGAGRPLRDFVPLKEQKLALVEFRRHAPDHLAARPRVSLGADLPALRTEFIQLLEHVRYVVGGPGHGLVLKGFHLPRPPGEVLCRHRPVRSGSVMRVRGVSASSSPERPDHCMDRTIVPRYKLAAARVAGLADLRS